MVRVLLALILIINAATGVAQRSYYYPSSGSNPLCATNTRANIIALRNSSSLTVGCSYIVNDHVQGRLVAGTTITLTAVAVNEFSENVHVNSTYDNEAWRGIYDIDRALVLELQDNRNNIARGFNGLEVANFDWGNTAYTNVVVDNATLTVTIGSTGLRTNVEIRNGSTMTLTGHTGALSNVDIFNQSSINLTNATCGLLGWNLNNGSTVNMTSYTGGNTLTNYTLVNGSINYSSSTSQVTLSVVYVNSATINHTGVTTGTISGTRVDISNNASITHSAGALNLSLNRVVMANSSSINHSQGTITISDYEIYGSSQVNSTTGTGGNISLTTGKINGSSVITNQSAMNLNGTRLNLDRVSGISLFNGATGTITLTGSKLDISSSIAVNATSTANYSITNTDLINQGTISLSGQAAFNISRSTIANASNIQTQNLATSTSNLSDMEFTNQSQYVVFASATAGIANINTSVLTNNSFIYKRGTGNLTISATNMNNSSRIDNISGDRNYSISRVSMNELSQINLSGTGAIQDNILDCSMQDRAVISISATGLTANQILYGSFTGLSSGVTFTGTTTGQVVQQSVTENGTITFTNCTAANSHSQLYVRGGGTIQVTGLNIAKTLNNISVAGGGNFLMNTPTATGAISNVMCNEGGTCSITAACGSVTQVSVHQGTLNLNGGATHVRIDKKMLGTLTSGNFTLQNVIYYSTVNLACTANNTNRTTILGFTSTVPVL